MLPSIRFLDRFLPTSSQSFDQQKQTTKEEEEEEEEEKETGSYGD
jgi:hypothetical protein